MKKYVIFILIRIGILFLILDLNTVYEEKIEVRGKAPSFKLQNQKEIILQKMKLDLLKLVKSNYKTRKHNECN